MHAETLGASDKAIKSSAFRKIDADDDGQYVFLAYLCIKYSDDGVLVQHYNQRSAGATCL